jgi:hypothetical protein
MYMEMSQGNSLCSYLKQTKMKFFFSFTKSENRRVEQVLPGGIGATGRGAGGGERVWDGEYSANTVYTCIQRTLLAKRQ